MKRTGAEDISTTGEAKAEETVPPRSAEEVPASEY